MVMDLKYPNYYSILNCVKGSTPQQILTEYKIKVLESHPDKNLEDNIRVHFELLTKAKNILINPTSKQSYDVWLESDLPISFDKFLEMTRFGANHWISSDSTKMIKEGDMTANNIKSENSNYKSSLNDLDLETTKAMFRAYKI